MKKVLFSCALLALFALFALSFCVLRFGVADTVRTPVSVHYAEEKESLGKLHVTISRDAVDATKDLFGCIKDSAKALPFFLTDAADALGKEAVGVVSLFSELLSADAKNGAVAI